MYWRWDLTEPANGTAPDIGLAQADRSIGSDVFEREAEQSHPLPVTQERLPLPHLELLRREFKEGLGFRGRSMLALNVGCPR
jgi:hypothetical protein